MAKIKPCVTCSMQNSVHCISCYVEIGGNAPNNYELNDPSLRERLMEYDDKREFLMKRINKESRLPPTIFMNLSSQITGKQAELESIRQENKYLEKKLEKLRASPPMTRARFVRMNDGYDKIHNQRQ